MGGCSYKADDVLGGGNLQVQQGAGSGGGAGDPTTLVLDPLLLTEGSAGFVQFFAVASSRTRWPAPPSP